MHCSPSRDVAVVAVELMPHPLRLHSMLGSTGSSGLSSSVSGSAVGMGGAGDGACAMCAGG
jgi:hypothetical protein